MNPVPASQLNNEPSVAPHRNVNHVHSAYMGYQGLSGINVLKRSLMNMAPAIDDVTHFFVHRCENILIKPLSNGQWNVMYLSKYSLKFGLLVIFTYILYIYIYMSC